MDVSSLVITIPFLITVFGLILSIQNYKLNKKKNDSGDVDKEREKEARMVRIEADVSYIRQSVDRTEERLSKVEDRVDKLDVEVAGLKNKN